MIKGFPLDILILELALTATCSRSIVDVLVSYTPVSPLLPGARCRSKKIINTHTHKHNHCDDNDGTACELLICSKTSSQQY